MRLIFLILYFISLAASLAIFHFTQAFSPKVSDGYVGGNGNPGMMFFFFGYPFLTFFIYGTIEYMMRYLMDKQKRKWFDPTLILAGVITVGIFTYNFLSALQIRQQIAKEIPQYGSVADISLINPYTNDVFFSWVTFLAILLFCYFIGGLWAKKRRKKTRKSASKNSLINNA